MFVHQPTKSLVLKSRDPERIIKTLGERNARRLTSPHGNVVVRHTLDAVRVLRNMGVKSAPSPILTEYQWPGKFTPFDHQRTMAEVLTVHPRVFNLSEMGTGKTGSALWAADYLMSVGQVRRVAILCPLSTMHSIWKEAIFEFLLHRKCVVVHGGREARAKALAMNVDFYIINHHGIALNDVAEELRRRKDIDLIILDEASVFRNHRTNMYRFLMWVMEKVGKRFWVMTGTPTPTEPGDAWALARMIAPDNVPMHKGEFERQTMVQVNDRNYPKRGYEKIVYDAMQPAVRFKKSECLDLPPVSIIQKQTALSKEQQKAFASMRDEMMAEVASGVKLTAVHAADRVNKLRQILCGAVLDTNTGQYTALDNGPRLRDLLDTIHEAEAKVIVIVPFKGIIRTLQGQLSSAGISVGVLNGDVSLAQRRAIIHDFKNNADPHLLLCHPRVMAHGLNLTEADLLIFYAPIYSYDEYAQVVERFNRAGQTRKMTVVRMGAHPLEWSIYKTLDSRGMTQQTVLDLYEEVTIREA